VQETREKQTLYLEDELMSRSELWMNCATKRRTRETNPNTLDTPSRVNTRASRVRGVHTRLRIPLAPMSARRKSKHRAPGAHAVVANTLFHLDSRLGLNMKWGLMHSRTPKQRFSFGCIVKRDGSRRIEILAYSPLQRHPRTNDGRFT
jgi:hypothetical protein